MDDTIRAIQDRFAGRVRFVSCDVDRAENVELCRRCGIANIPAVGLIVAGEIRPTIIGFRQPSRLISEIETRLAEPAGAIESRQVEPTPRAWWAFWRRDEP